jgi:biotin synthase
MFCSQRRAAPPHLREKLSRVTWPARRLGEVLDALTKNRHGFVRVCLQSVLKPGFFRELVCMARLLSSTGIPLSVASTPVHRRLLVELAEAGAERLGVGLDAASPRVADAVGKPYPWSVYVKFIEDGVSVFGDGMVHVHLVAGLGETPREMIDAMRMIYGVGGRVALFRYTPLPGLPRLPGVGIRLYRFYQVSRLLLEKGLDPLDYAVLEPEPRFVETPPLSPKELAEALVTSGCPGCNRPYYNEGPRGPLYNYPSRSALWRNTSWIRELRGLGLDVSELEG